MHTTLAASSAFTRQASSLKEWISSPCPPPSIFIHRPGDPCLVLAYLHQLVAQTPVSATAPKPHIQHIAAAAAFVDCAVVLSVQSFYSSIINAFARAGNQWSPVEDAALNHDITDQSPEVIQDMAQWSIRWQPNDHVQAIRGVIAERPNASLPAFLRALNMLYSTIPKSRFIVISNAHLLDHLDPNTPDLLATMLSLCEVCPGYTVIMVAPRELHTFTNLRTCTVPASSLTFHSLNVEVALGLIESRYCDLLPGPQLANLQTACKHILTAMSPNAELTVAGVLGVAASAVYIDDGEVKVQNIPQVRQGLSARLSQIGGVRWSQNDVSATMRMKRQTAKTASLSLTGRLLLVGSYVCSHNTPKTDLRMLAANSEYGSKRKGGKKARVANRYHNVRSFAVERLLAVVHCLTRISGVEGPDEFDIESQLNRLIRLRMICKTSGSSQSQTQVDKIEGLRLQCNVERDMVDGAARESGLVLSELLAD